MDSGCERGPFLPAMSSVISRLRSKTGENGKESGVRQRKFQGRGLWKIGGARKSPKCENTRKSRRGSARTEGRGGGSEGKGRRRAILCEVVKKKHRLSKGSGGKLLRERKYRGKGTKKSHLETWPFPTLKPSTKEKDLRGGQQRQRKRRRSTRTHKESFPSNREELISKEKNEGGVSRAPLTSRGSRTKKKPFRRKGRTGGGTLSRGVCCREKEVERKGGAGELLELCSLLILFSPCKEGRVAR